MVLLDTSRGHTLGGDQGRSPPRPQRGKPELGSAGKRQLPAEMRGIFQIKTPTKLVAKFDVAPQFNRCVSWGER